MKNTVRGMVACSQTNHADIMLIVLVMGPDGPMLWHIEMVYILGWADKWYISF